MRAALAFLTVVGGARPLTTRALPWFPVVGAALGGTLGVALWGASRWWPPLLAAALVVALDLALTGMLHLDGLADAADGLLAPMERERRLAVMAGPEVGAFGVGAVVAVLGVRAAALAALASGSTWRTAAALAAIWALARAAMTVAVTTQPPARPGGLAAALAGGSAAGPAALAAVAAAVAALVAWPLGAPAAGLGLAGGAAVVVLARRRLGGVTGDVLGATGVVVETVALVVLAAGS